MEKKKRRFGDRKDGFKLRTLSPLTRVSPYIMVERNAASNLFTDSIDIGRVEEYIRDKRREGLAGFGIMHVIVAAYVRCISQKPAINRFIAGQKIFKRDGVEIMLTVKRDMSAESEETIIKLEPELTATATEIYQMFKTAIDESKADDAKVKNIPGVMGLVKQGGQYQVPGFSCGQRQANGVQISHLAQHDHIRVFTQRRA